MITDFKIFEETKMVKIIYAKDVYDKYGKYTVGGAKLIADELNKELAGNEVRVEATNDGGKTYFDIFWAHYVLINEVVVISRKFVYLHIKGSYQIISNDMRFTVKLRTFSEEDPYGEENWGND